MALADDDNTTPEWVTAEQAVVLLGNSFDELETRMQRSESGLCRLSVRSGDDDVDVVPLDAAWLWQHRGRPQIDYTRSRVFCLYQAPDKPSASWQWASIRFCRNVLVPPAAPSPEVIPVPRKQVGRPPGAGAIDDSVALRELEELIANGMQPEEAKCRIAERLPGNSKLESKMKRLERKRGEPNSP